MTQSVECFLRHSAASVRIYCSECGDIWMNKWTSRYHANQSVVRARKNFFPIPKLRKIEPQRMFATGWKMFTDRSAAAYKLWKMCREVKLVWTHVLQMMKRWYRYLPQKVNPILKSNRRLLAKTFPSKHYSLPSVELRADFEKEELLRQINYFQISRTNQSSPWLIADWLWLV